MDCVTRANHLPSPGLLLQPNSEEMILWDGDGCTAAMKDLPDSLGETEATQRDYPTPSAHLL